MGSRDRRFHCCRCKKWHPWSDLSKTEEFGARRRRCVHCDKRQREKQEKGPVADDERTKALARTFAKRCEESIRQHIDGMYLTFSGEMADTIRTALNEYAETLKSQDVYHELASRAERIDDLERRLTAESKWPTCHECGGILIFDQEEPVATCENGCYSTEWGSQENGDHWRDVQQKFMARGKQVGLKPDEETAMKTAREICKLLNIRHTPELVAQRVARVIDRYIPLRGQRGDTLLTAGPPPGEEDPDG